MRVFINTTVWMHHLDGNKIFAKKATWELYKNAMCYFEQILEATPHKTAAVWPLTSRLKNHPSKMKNMWRSISDILPRALTHGHASVGRPGRTCISSVWTLDVLWRTCQEGWLIRTDGERESQENLLPV